MNSHVYRYLAQTKTDELLRQAADRRRVVEAEQQRPWISAAVRRAARRVRGSADGWPRPAPSADADVRIRYARQDDDAALRRLAELDSASVPAAPLLIGEVGGELRAAMSLVDSAVIADPFRPTVALVELLRVRAVQLGAARAAEGKRPSAEQTRRLAFAARREELAAAHPADGEHPHRRSRVESFR